MVMGNMQLSGIQKLTFVLLTIDYPLPNLLNHGFLISLAQTSLKPSHQSQETRKSKAFAVCNSQKLLQKP
jgi:hypothetical protein